MLFFMHPEYHLEFTMLSVVSKSFQPASYHPRTKDSLVFEAVTYFKGSIVGLFLSSKHWFKDFFCFS